MANTIFQVPSVYLYHNKTMTADPIQWRKAPLQTLLILEYAPTPHPSGCQGHYIRSAWRPPPRDLCTDYFEYPGPSSLRNHIKP